MMKKILIALGVVMVVSLVGLLVHSLSSDDTPPFTQSSELDRSGDDEEARGVRRRRSTAERGARDAEEEPQIEVAPSNVLIVESAGQQLIVEVSSFSATSAVQSMAIRTCKNVDTKTLPFPL